MEIIQIKNEIIRRKQELTEACGGVLITATSVAMNNIYTSLLDFIDQDGVTCEDLKGIIACLRQIHNNLENLQPPQKNESVSTLHIAKDNLHLAIECLEGILVWENEIAKR